MTKLFPLRGDARLGRGVFPTLAMATMMLLLLSGCAPPQADEPAASPAPDQADVSSFYEQDLEPAACSDFAVADSDQQIMEMAAQPAQCGRLTVPIDYNEPAAGTASLAVLRVPASSDDVIGSLIVNPGGPGQTGTSFAAVVSLLLAVEGNPIVDRFDIVGFDPRGVGASEPAIDCFTDAERDADATLAMPMTFPAAHAWTAKSAAALANRCAEGSGGVEMLEQLGTVSAVRDLDVLRAVLGDDKLSYAGGSYGTRLGAVYAETFPHNVRAMVLDGAIHPEQSSLDRIVEQAAGIQAAFDDLAEWCAEDVPDCPFGTDPAAAVTIFQDAVQPLGDDPMTVADGRELTHAGAVAGAVNALFASSTWGDLVAAFRELKAGRPEAMMALQDSFFLRNGDGSYVNFTEANMAWNCNDEDRNAPEREREMREEVSFQAPLFATGDPIPDDLVSPCASWPGEQSLPWPHAVTFPGLPKTLVMAVTGDPATPASVSELLADRMGASFLPVEGRQHGAMFVGLSACVNGFVADYLIDMQTPPASSTCSLDNQAPVIN